MTSEDVINRLAELFVIYGVPECIRSDNGPEFVSHAIQKWLAAMGIKTLYVEPGTPGKMDTPRVSTVACEMNC